MTEMTHRHDQAQEASRPVTAIHPIYRARHGLSDSALEVLNDRSATMTTSS